MPDPAPDTRPFAVKALHLLLALSVPALLICALWMWDWRWAATALVIGVTSLLLAAPSRPPKVAPREDLP